MNFKDVYKREMDEIHVPEGLFETDSVWDEQMLERRAGNTMKKIRIRKAVVAAVLACFIVAGGATVYAAVRFFTASEVADKMDKPKLANKFAELSDVAITQENDTYRVSYLGEVTGNKLSEYEMEADREKTYFVLAVEKKDGTAVTYDDSIEASPFIKGMAPWQFNIYTMGGNAESTIIKGIRYFIYECENIEIFADRGVYLGVSDSAPNADIYSFDEKSGVIESNQKYEGLNMLFELDIDEAKADTKKAEEYLGQMEEDLSADDEEEEEGDSILDRFHAWRTQFRSSEDMTKYIVEHGKLMKESVRTVKPDKNGVYHYDWKVHVEGATLDLNEGQMREMYEVNVPVLGGGFSEGEDGSLMFGVRVLNEDESVTFSYYEVDIS